MWPCFPYARATPLGDRSLILPILPREPMVFPEDLFTAEPTDQTWWVLHTKPRTEKALARDLRHAGVPHFLPQYAKRQKTKSRETTTYLPLFTSYLFLRGEPKHRLVALQTDHVANCLEVPDQVALQQQLSGICKVVSHDPTQCEPKVSIGIGDPVEVLEGPFAGMTGHVIRVEKGYKFIVGVKFLHQSVEVPLGHWAFRSL